MTNERLIHFSDKPLGEIYSVDPTEKGTGWQKPKGLWVSVEGNEDGWKDWCAQEEFHPERLAIENEITLLPDAAVLRISDALSLIDFTKRFQGESDMEQSPYMRGIDWGSVGKQYQGIIVAPYIWSCRLHDETFWYYGWDCASGCIWDAKAIASVKQVTPESIPG